MGTGSDRAAQGGTGRAALEETGRAVLEGVVLLTAGVHLQATNAGAEALHLCHVARGMLGVPVTKEYAREKGTEGEVFTCKFPLY